jgi:hypothetical protein
MPEKPIELEKKKSFVSSVRVYLNLPCKTEVGFMSTLFCLYDLCMPVTKKILHKHKIPLLNFFY